MMMCVSCNRKKGRIAKYITKEEEENKKKINWIVWHVIKLREMNVFHVYTIRTIVRARLPYMTSFIAKYTKD